MRWVSSYPVLSPILLSRAWQYCWQEHSTPLRHRLQYSWRWRCLIAYLWAQTMSTPPRQAPPDMTPSTCMLRNQRFLYRRGWGRAACSSLPTWWCSPRSRSWTWWCQFGIGSRLWCYTWGNRWDLLPPPRWWVLLAPVEPWSRFWWNAWRWIRGQCSCPRMGRRSERCGRSSFSCISRTSCRCFGGWGWRVLIKMFWRCVRVRGRWRWLFFWVTGSGGACTWGRRAMRLPAWGGRVNTCFMLFCRWCFPWVYSWQGDG